MMRNIANRWPILAMLGSLSLSAPAASQDDYPAAITAQLQRVHELFSAGRSLEALGLGEALEPLVRDRLGSTHPLYGFLLTELGLISSSQCDLVRAEDLLLRALPIIRKIRQENVIGLMASMHSNLSLIYEGLGRQADAEHSYIKARTINEKEIRRDSAQWSDQLQHIAAKCWQQKQFADAERFFSRSVQILENLQPRNDAALTVALLNLAAAYHDIGRRYVEAEVLVRQALTIREKLFGLEDHSTKEAARKLVVLGKSIADDGYAQYFRGELQEAERSYLRALSIYERAGASRAPEAARALNNLGAMYADEGRFSEAEGYYDLSLEIRVAALGPDDAEVAETLHNRGNLLASIGKIHDSIDLYKRAFAIREARLPHNDPLTVDTILSLAEVYLESERLELSTNLWRKALEIEDVRNPTDYGRTAKALHGLARTYQQYGLIKEAQLLNERSVNILTTAFGPHHDTVTSAMHNLGITYEIGGRDEDAAEVFKRVIEICAKVADEKKCNPARSLFQLANVEKKRGNLKEAGSLLRRGLTLYEATLGPDHPHAAIMLRELAHLQARLGANKEALKLLEQAAASLERSLPPENPLLVLALIDLAVEAHKSGDTTRALELSRRATAVLGPKNAIKFDGYMPEHSGNNRERLKSTLRHHVTILFSAARKDKTSEFAYAEEAFMVAQSATNSTAGSSLLEMAARFGGATDAGYKIRLAQDFVKEWRSIDRRLVLALSTPLHQRNHEIISKLKGEASKIESSLTSLKGEIESAAPKLGEYVTPQPLSFADVRKLLSPSEALIVYFQVDEDDTFIWLITRDKMRWARLSSNALILRREVTGLRCGLDPLSWNVNFAKCFDSQNDLGRQLLGGKSAAPFDLIRAHELYKVLFGDVADLIEAKHLIVIPSGPLNQLPFQVLVKRYPKTNDYKSAAWLVRDHALTVLPEISSLRALRSSARPSAAHLPIIGFGNPLLDGDQAQSEYGSYYKQQAALARDRQVCPENNTERVTTRRGARDTVRTAMRRGVIDPADLRRQAPLPETVDELCEVARVLGAASDDIRLGERATESEIKTLSAGGTLARYRILHFATHGALAGQVGGATEPGLVLTPPIAPTHYDDGYLSASEIAGLKLDADWVILSACNTAGGAGNEAADSEALSGIARAFFYAQARALLVSHWEVDSTATVKLIISTVQALSHGKNVGRAEALRRGMLALIDGADPVIAHPTYWAPFVLVGEGSR